MSTLQVANIFFESTSNNGLIYGGSNNFSIRVAGANTLSVNSTGLVFSDGTYVNSAHIVGFGGITVTNTQTFNASGTWVKPASGKFVVTRLWGGGGSGGANSTASATGGGGGAFHEGVFDFTSFSGNVTVTVGAGGAGVSGTGTVNGNPGGTTSFGAFISSFGGGGGRSQASAGGSGGGSGGVGGTSDGSWGGSNIPGGIAAADINQSMVALSINGLSPTGTITNTISAVETRANVRNGAGAVADGGTEQPGYSSTYGGGSGGNTKGAAATPQPGGNSVWGGAGGGSKGATSVTGATGGVSTYGGNGSAASLTTSLVGTQPAGGSGAGTTASANGGAGRCVVYVLG